MRSPPYSLKRGWHSELDSCCMMFHRREVVAPRNTAPAVLCCVVSLDTMWPESIHYYYTVPCLKHRTVLCHVYVWTYRCARFSIHKQWKGNLPAPWLIKVVSAIRSKLHWVGPDTYAKHTNRNLPSWLCEVEGKNKKKRQKAKSNFHPPRCRKPSQRHNR